MSANAKQVDLLTVAGNRVLETNGEYLGDLQRIVANLGDGRIEYATLRLAGDSPDPPKFIAIPWSQFSLSPDGHHLQLDFSLTVLRTFGAGQGG